MAESTSDYVAGRIQTVLMMIMLGFLCGRAIGEMLVAGTGG